MTVIAHLRVTVRHPEYAEGDMPYDRLTVFEAGNTPSAHTRTLQQLNNELPEEAPIQERIDRLLEVARATRAPFHFEEISLRV